MVKLFRLAFRAGKMGRAWPLEQGFSRNSKGIWSVGTACGILFRSS
jgi:hypothetical protein